MDRAATRPEVCLFCRLLTLSGEGREVTIFHHINKLELTCMCIIPRIYTKDGIIVNIDKLT